MLIVSASQSKVVLELAPEEFSRLMEQARLPRRPGRYVVVATGDEPSTTIPLASTLQRVTQ